MAMIEGYPPWIRSLAFVRDECEGVFLVVPLTEAEVPSLVAAAKLGPSRALLALGSIVNSEQWINRPQPDTPAMPCQGCGKPLLTPDWTYGIVMADIPAPTMAVALPACRGCAPDRSLINKAITPALQVVWPNVRDLHGPIHAAGHA